MTTAGSFPYLSGIDELHPHTIHATKESGFAMADNTSTTETAPSTTPKGIGRRLDTAGWGLFLIWVGASFLMDLGWGVGLIGVAAVIFVMQVARRYYGRNLERFRVVRL